MHNGNKIDQAVILAAGNGRRMVPGFSLPKPMIPVGGRPLLTHILGWLDDQGIKKVFLVVGYRGDEIQRGCSNQDLNLDIEWIRNPEFKRPNGISLLSVEERIDRPFVLLMSDHFFEKSTLGELLERGAPKKGGVLATDAKIGQVFDLEDATKVSSDGHLIRRMGKNLRRFDSVDTGMFALTPAVFSAMHESLRAGDASLTGGVATLARRGMMESWDIGARRWIDIDTPEARHEAERMVASGCFS